MIKNWFWTVLMSPLTLLAQEKGIAFENTLSWDAIVQKAKVEHKYVFVDCFASWCGPCKVMDRDVYSNDSLGVWMNQRFVSLKVQMDSTGRDKMEVQKWYAVAHRLERDYRIKAYPSFLFFSPDGQAVDKEIGGRDVKAFMEMAASAMDPANQFYTLLLRYQNGDKIDGGLPKLARTAKSIGEDSLANIFATKYMHSKLPTFPAAERWSKDNISFINDFGNDLDLTDKLFKSYFKDRQTVNQVMNDTNYAYNLINQVVYDHLVKPAIEQGVKTNVEPKWIKLEKTIQKDYGVTYVDRNIVPGKVEYYRSTKQWELYARYLVLRLKQVRIETWPPGGMNGLFLNNDAFEVFKYSKDKEELEAALSWVERALSVEDNPNPGDLDTKANILYKLGRAEEGLKLEAQAASMSNDKDILDAYDKMKRGLPTWPTL